MSKTREGLEVLVYVAVWVAIGVFSFVGLCSVYTMLPPGLAMALLLTILWMGFMAWLGVALYTVYRI